MAVIERRHGDLLKSEAESVINTVNCVGVMGKGLARSFKNAYKRNYWDYKRACAAGEVVPGKVFVHRCDGALISPKYIFNFPTKRHWNNPSRVSDIELGLVDLAAQCSRLGIASVAIPPLGCGEGALDWHEVWPKVVKALEALPGLRVTLYDPKGFVPRCAADNSANNLTRSQTSTPTRL